MRTVMVKASCVIVTIRPAYPWATTLTMDVRKLLSGPVSGACPSIGQIRLTARSGAQEGATVESGFFISTSMRRSITGQ